MTIELEDNFVNSLKKEFNNLEVKDIIYKLYQSYKEKSDNNLDIELITKESPDYQILSKAREERKKHPENYETIDEIDWD